MTNRLLRILCLHGMSQNATHFQKRTAAFRNEVEGIAEFVYITAPHVVLDPEHGTIAERSAAREIDTSEELKPHAWWFNDTYKAVGEDGFYCGARESFEYIKRILLERGPFDGIMGFSQGGCVAAMLTEMLEDRSVIPEIMPPEFRHPPLKFAILAGAFKPREKQTATHNVLFSRKHKIKTPSLHVIGAVDTIIVPERMKELTTAFADPILLEHPGGHFVPSNSAARKRFAAFVSKFVLA